MNIAISGFFGFLETQAGKVRSNIRLLGTLALGLGCFFCLSCSEPVPLYGMWADNYGSTLSFFDDSTFNAVIAGGGTGKKAYNGNYSILLNSLTLSSAEIRVVTEWDIRGNMLYLDWPAEDRTIALTLYKVSN
jgi:hypothetical protein